MTSAVTMEEQVDRGHYEAIDGEGQPCGHRHYELSRSLRHCLEELHASGGRVIYVDEHGEARPARPDEMAELRCD